MSEEKQLDAEPLPENKEEPVVEDDKLSSKQKDIKPKSNGLFIGMTTMLSLAALIAAGLIGYLGYQQFQHMSARLLTLEQETANNQSVSNSTKDELQRNFTQLQSQLQKQLQDSILNQDTDSDSKIQTISEQLAATRRQIQSVSGRHQSDWLLAEADYLVRIASNRLLLERDHVTALALLMSADERIVLMDDPSLQPAREALARDMAMLRLLKREDIAGIAFRISGLIPQLKTLPILAFQLPEDTLEEIEQPVSSANTSWYENLKQAAAELSVKWFEIRDHGRPVTPLMAPETETLLVNNMMLQLQTAQYSVLRQHSELYHHSLTQLKTRVTEYFDINDQIVIAFLNEIDSLNAMSIRAELPDSLQARVIISRLVEQRLQQSIAPVAAESATGEEQ